MTNAARLRNLEDIFRLSPVQQGMLYHTLTAPGTGIYHEQFTMSYGSGFDPDLFVAAWRREVERQPVLRTSLLWEDLDEPVQVVHRTAEVPVERLDWRELEEAEQEERLERFRAEDRRRGFDLTRPPLTRLALIRVGDESWRVVWSYHHVLLDGWSAGLVIREISRIYLALSRDTEPELPQRRPFRDYIRWLRQQDLSEAREYWRRRFGDFSRPTPLVVDRPRDDGEDRGYELRATRLSARDSERIRRFAQEHRVTQNTLVQAAYALLLSRYSGQDDVVFGVTVSGRPPSLRGVDGMIGCFINTLPVRVTMDPDAEVLPWLRAIQADQVELRKFEHTPLVEVTKASRVDRDQELFESIVVFESFTGESAVEMTHEGVFQRTNYPLTMVASPADEMALRAGYELARFDAATVDRLMGHLGSLLARIVERPGARLADLGVLTPEEERAALLEWNGPPSEHRTGETLHGLFERHVATHPDRVAVSAEEGSLTYGGLSAAADRLARALRRRGVGPETLVGLSVERRLEMVVGILGILKSGAAYLPLDPHAPQERLRFLVEDSGAPVVVTAGDGTAALGPAGVERVRLDSVEGSVEDSPADGPGELLRDGAPEPEDGAAPEPPGGPAHLAYVIYTSGSTGRPKGSLITHENVQRLLAATEEWFRFGPEDTWTLFHSYAFDFSVWELWGALAYGGRLVVVPYWVSRSPERFHALLRRERVTVLNQTPSAFKQLVAADGASGGTVDPPDLALRSVVFGGEALEPANLAPWFERHGDRRPVLVNMFGITETTVHVTYRPLAAEDTRDGGASPVGRPIPDLDVHLLDRWLHLVPVGPPGEVHVGGPGLARGYLGRPALTAERFIPHPFAGRAGEATPSPGSRLYKAGDLARRLPGGELDFLGRIDQQVKVRGFRIELGEIEAVVARHPAVAQVAVVAREDQPGDRRLVAYVVPVAEAEDRREDLPRDLRAHAGRFLPDYMVPAAVVELDALPLTVNGKLDREALPVPEEAGRLDVSVELEPPVTPTEELVAGIWSEVLGVERVGRNDDFFDLGGHSLLATRMATRLREVFGAAPPLRDLFEAPTVAAVATLVERERTGAALGQAAPPMERLPGDRKLQGVALSFAQERLWFLARMEPESSAYNVPGAVRLVGSCDLSALAGAVAGIVRRHESLRTVFAIRDGRPVQRVREDLRVGVPVLDLSALPPERARSTADRLAADAVERPFDLYRGPLVRTHVVRLGPREHAISVTTHHIVSDGWSLGVFVRELAALYGAAVRGEEADLPELPVQYPDFAVWQRGWLQGEVLERELGFWREQLAGAPAALELPTDRPRPPVQSYRGDTLGMRLPEEVARGLQELARRRGATLFMVLSAAFASLLHRYSGQEDVVLGSTIANRNRPETQGLIGFFVNTLALRNRLEGDPSFGELVDRVREVSLGAYDHQDLPFEKLVDEIRPQRDLSRSPVFQVLLQLLNVPTERLELPGLALEPMVADTRTAKFDLILNLTELEAGIHGLWRYKTDLFDASTVQRMASHLGILAAAVAEDPERPVSELPLLSRAEGHQAVVEWGDAPGWRWPGWDGRAVSEPVHARVEAWADRVPDGVAVSGPGGTLTYGALEARANRLAHRLRALGVAPESPVAVCLERSPELVVAILGVLKAGGAYVPLDPAHPAERTAFTLEDSGARVLVSQESLVASLGGAVGGAAGVTPVVLGGAGGEDLAAWPAHRPEPWADGASLAYVIYTSGSTGRPKGVPVPHGNAVRLLEATQRWFGFGSGDAWTLFHSAAFDFSVWELWGPLAHGGRLVVVPYGVSRSPDAFHELLARERVTVLNQTPSAFRQLVRADAGAARLDALRWVVFGGEALELASLAPWFRRYGDSGPGLVNMYGITETTVHVTHRPVRPEDVAAGRGSVIGRAIPDLSLQVVDPRCRPVPLGVAGEIQVGGAGVARGYLGRAALTAERFVPDPCGEVPGGRLYRSGDLARRLPAGDLEYLGRIDHQVKVRGFRVELGEIESTLAAHPEVAEAVVLAREAPGEAGTGPRLVAYLVASGAARPSVEALRSHAGRTLPEHMVPSAFVVLDALPLTANGKVDRRALPEPEQARPELAQELVAPRDRLEAGLAELWQEVLGLDRVGIHDDFFDLGGNSLAGAVLVNRLQELLGEIVHVVVIFDAPTIARMAEHLRDQHAAGLSRWLGEAAPSGSEAGAAEEEAPADGAMVERLRRALGASGRFMPRREPAGPPNPPAVFVLSAPRSGSTLLRVMLGGHPGLFAPPELELLSFGTMAERAEVFRGRDAFWREGLLRAVLELEGTDADGARELVASWEAEGRSTQSVYRALQERLGERLLVDKTPSYALDPDVLARAEEEFAGARYVHLVRHPYGMIRSFEEARLDQIFFRAEHPFSRRRLAELIWILSEQNVRAFLDGVPAERRHQVRFEDLVRRPQRTLEALCTFLGIEYVPAMAEPYRDRSGRMTDGLHDASRMLGDVKFHQHHGVDPAVADAWRDTYERDFLGEVTWSLAADLGYDPADGAGRARPDGHRLEPLVPAEWRPEEPLPLSFAQERLWFLDRLEPGSAAYNVPTAVRLRGRLGLLALASALDAVEARHAGLRTVFRATEGRPVQVVLRRSGRRLPLVDLSGLPAARARPEGTRLASAEARRPFDLETGPLLRSSVLRFGAEEHVVLLTMHHIVSDGWSMGVLVQDLGALYAGHAGAAAGGAPDLPELPVQYPDFAIWQRRTVTDRVLRDQLDYWRRQLAGVPALQLPMDRPRPAVQTFRGAARRFPMPEDVAGGLLHLADASGATLYVVLLAAFQAHLARLSGQRDFAVGTPFANRNRREIEHLIGFFVNTLVLRGDLEGDPTFEELVERARNVARDAFAHQDVTFERVVQEVQPERTLNVPPLFQVMLALQGQAPAGRLELPELRLEPQEAEGSVSKFDLSLTVVESGNAMGTQWVWNVDLFDRTTVQRFGRSFEVMLRAVAEDPALPLSRLPLLAAGERQQLLVEWNLDQPAFAAGRLVPELVAEQGTARPDAVAVVFDGGALTYRELDRRSGALARTLAAAGSGAEGAAGAESGRVVAVAAERSPELVVALLGVLRAGCAYLPLDPELPPERLAFLVADSGATTVLTQERLVPRLREALGRPARPGRREGSERPDDSAGPTLRALDAAGGEPLPGRAGPGAPLPRLHAEDAAYVLYTSGSTGRPKGVVVPHGALAHRIAWARAFDAGPDDALLQKTTISFDVSLHELLTPLAGGGRTVLVPPGGEKDTRLLARRLREERVTMASFPPPLLAAMLEEEELEGPTDLHTVISGGEALPPELAERFRRRHRARLLNRYGPTETTISVTSWTCRPVRQGRALPLGRPKAGARVHVLDAALEPLPAGAVGEVVLGGPTVARGYHERPGRTAGSFVPDPFAREPGRRLYRTGDLGRLGPAGDLEFKGRIDHQVKIRGFRVELGEIETVLARHSGVRKAAVVDRGDGRDKTLVAFVVPEPEAEPTPEELREHVRRSLPAYMVPFACAVLEAMPSTPTGKVDRRALARLETGAAAAMEVAHEPPEGPVETVLAGIWADVLGLDRVGRHDPFFELGGHSLLATRVVARARKELGVDLPLRALFESPTPAELAAAIEARRRPDGAGSAPPPLLPRTAAAGAKAPLSFAQERLWFLEQLEVGQAVYNVPLAARFRGALERRALVRAIDRVVARHEVLRTTFRADGGRPEQVVHAHLPPARVDVDLSGLPGGPSSRAVEDLTRRFAGRPFALERGPLVRMALLRVAPREHVVLVTLHHMVADQWSMAVLLGELGAAYRAEVAGDAPDLPDLPVQYADYAAWQREWLRDEVLEREVDFWRDRLAGAPELLELPGDRARPAVRSLRGGRVDFRLPPEVARGFQALGRRRGATLFMNALAVYAGWLGRVTGQDDLMVGSPVANRDRAEVAHLIGFFLNTLPLRADLAGDPHFETLVDRARSTALEAFDHQDVPFEKLVEELGVERSLSHAPLFQVALVVRAGDGEGLDLPGVTVERLRTDSGASNFDLALSLAEAGDALVGQWVYNRDLFDRSTLERLAGSFAAFAAEAATRPGRRLSELPLLEPRARHQVLLEWNAAPSEHSRHRVIPELVAEQVSRRPDAVAVALERGCLTYRELDRRSAAVARRLGTLGAGADAPVAVAMERGPELVPAVLGVLRAGCPYLPLDPELPADRLAFMVRDAGVGLILTQPALVARLREALDGAGRVHLEVLGGPPPELPGAPPPRRDLTPELAAYVIYTSGSTGRPKGVVVSHGALANRIAWGAAVDVDADDAILQKTTVSFDVSLHELFTPLAAGGRVVLPRPGGEKDAAYLVHRLAEERVTVCSFAPTLLSALLEEEAFADLPALHTVISGGEALSPELAERFRRLRGGRLLNRYGPTETTISVTSWPCERLEGEGSMPLGRPSASAAVYAVDAALRPLPAGCAGEVVVGGPSVARGYLGRPGRTAGSFVPDPFAAAPGSRLYRTGDLGRLRPDGALEFAGRIDHQVKVRGFRVELGEIEAALARHTAVREAVVVARGEGRDRALVAYVVPEGAEPPAAGELRRAVESTLPAYMVPAAVLFLDSFPTKASGKVDRSALPEPELERTGPFEAPHGDEEELLANLWSALLGVERVGRHDDFFDLGGHSLRATQLVARVRESFGVELPLRALFEEPTVAGLAERLRAARRATGGREVPPLRARSHGGTAPVSFAQERLWFLDRLEPGSATYNLPATVRMEGTLALPAFRRSLDGIARRHEALRTTFRVDGGRPVQRIAPRGRVPLLLADLSGVAPARRAVLARELATREARRPFDLAAGPLVRVSLFRLGPEEHLAVVAMHHVVADGWSLGLFIRELAAGYRAALGGREATLPAPPVQYADFAVWQREWLRGEVLEDEIDHWRSVLAGAPAVSSVPGDRPRPPVQRFHGRRRVEVLPPELTAELHALARREGATLFMVLLAGFAVLAHRHGAPDDLVVGTPVAGRPRRELEGLIGFFLNTLPLRVEVSADRPFSELLAACREVGLEAFAHQDLPFERLVEELVDERSLSHAPLFQMMLVLQSGGPAGPAEGGEGSGASGDLSLPGLTLRPERLEGSTAKFDLTLNMAEGPGGLSCRWMYNLDLFDATTVERLIRHFEALLRAAVGDPGTAVGELPLLTGAERQQVMEWNDTRVAYPDGERSLPWWVERQAAATPESVAVVFEGEAWSYRALSAWSERLARRLARAGVGPGDLVGVHAERSPALVAALLGVVKAGAAYVPLDPDHPAERLAGIVEDAGLAVVLVGPDLADSRGFASRGLVLGEEAGEPDAAPDPDRFAGVPAEAPAYAIFTSGSTGRPKGVVNAHRGVVNRLLWMQEAFDLKPGDRVLQKTPFGFDVSVWEFFWPLMVGAGLVVARPGGHQDSAYLVDTVCRERVTTLHFVPSMLQVFLADPGAGRCSSLRRVIASGEALPAELASRWDERLAAPLYNLYGPTEAAIDVTWWPASGAERTVPIGVPVANTSIRVVDGALRPSPPGVPGEVVIGGVQVASGYLGRPGLTAERFVPDPASGTAGGRLYRTGDLGRRRPDGAVEYQGRLDHQVKLRGFRIEPGEIEAALVREATVREAVVTLRRDLPGGPGLVAYVVPEDALGRGDRQEELVVALRRSLAASLPEYMVPAALVVLDALPLSPNGKVDRRALPAPRREEGAGPSFRAPRNPLEEELTGLFREALGEGGGQRAVGLDDDFFDLGGNSIAGAVLINRLQERLGEIVHVVALFDAPTVAGLAAYLLREYPSAVERRWGVTAGEGAAGAGEETRRVDAARVAELRTLVEPRGSVALERKNPPAVLVLSPPRSGSTLLRVMLGGHPGLFAPPELELLRFATLTERRSAFSGRDAFRLEGAVRAVMEARGCSADEAEETIRELEESGATTAELYRRLQEWVGERLLVDKTPTYAWDPATLEAAEATFSEPRYVHLVRHPYGMIRSFEEAKLDEIFFRRREHGFGRRELAELLWVVSHENVLDFAHRVPPERFHTVRFEDLVGDPEATLRELCSFLGLDYHPAMADPYAPEGGRMTDGIHAESRMLGDVKFHQHRRIDPAVAERWRESYDRDFLGEPAWELAARLGYDPADRPGAPRPAIERIERRPGEAAPLSFAQERLWFLDRMEGASAAYNVPGAWRLRGALDAGALEAAFAGLVERHETLRTRFAAGPEHPVQVVLPADGFPLPRIDLSGLPEARRTAELERRVAGFTNRPFNLSRGRLLRAVLAVLGPDDHALLVNMHHIVSDGWSVGILLRELTALYRARTGGGEAGLPALPVQYADYAAWQRAWLSGGRLRAELAFWRDELGGAPPLDLPTDRPRPAVQTYRGAVRPVGFPVGLGRELRRLGRASGATPFMVLATGFAALLARYAGQEELTLGTPVANRTRWETEGLIGLFANTLVLRVGLGGRPGFRDLLERVRERSLRLYAHQEVPFEKVVEELQPRRDLARSPLFQVLFALQNARGERAELPGLAIEPVQLGVRSAKFELTLSVTEDERGVLGGLGYNSDLFDAATVDRMVRHLRMLFQAAVERPELPVDELPLLGSAERHQLTVEWNGTAEPAEETCLPDLIRARAREMPDAVAVVSGKRTLTYAKLGERVLRLAEGLRTAGVRPGDRVGLALERTEAMVVAPLATMAAGAAYVPLDPAYPVARITYALEDSGASALLLDGAAPALGAAELPAGVRRLQLTREGYRLEAAGAEPDAAQEPPRDRPTAGDLAYVIYTSGSTGRPKGVEIPHGALVNLLASMVERPGIGPEAALLAVTTLSFDIAALELFAPLLAGARVVVAPREATADGGRLQHLLARSRSTHLQATPATWRLLVESGWPGDPVLRALAGGEALPPDLARQVAGRVESLWNMYGPTETTIWSGTLRISGGPGPVPVGGPIAGTELAVVDPRLGAAPAGVPGELVIGGAGLARGYHGRPGQTAERFTPHPRPRRPGERLYRTGDLARFLSDGRMEFLGRMDHQVKLRGFRIELGEIEAVLDEHPDVRRTVVAVQGEGPEQRRLVAYLVTDRAVESSELRRFLRRHLPDYMVPGAFVALEELPLTPNGKVDRKALPSIGRLHLEGRGEAVPPRTETERRVAEIWSEVLGVDGVGVRDDFFELGGHSLLLIRVNRRLEEALGQAVPVIDLFRHSTVEALADYLDRDHHRIPPLPRGVVRLRSGPREAAPLFLVHPLSGELSLYRGLVGALEDGFRVFGFQAPLLEGRERAGERPDGTIEAMARRYAEALEDVQPEGPVHLAGSSMGGLVAWEMARRLEERGRPVALLALIDTPPPGRAARRERRDGETELALLRHLVAGETGLTLEAMQAMEADERLTYLLRRGRESGVLPSGYGLDELRRLVEVVRANQRAMETYRGGPWNGRPVLFRAAVAGSAVDGGPEAEDDAAWERLAAGGVERHEVPGDHITLHAPPHVERLAELLGEALRTRRGSATPVDPR